MSPATWHELPAVVRATAIGRPGSLRERLRARIGDTWPVSAPERLEYALDGLEDLVREDVAAAVGPEVSKAVGEAVEEAVRLHVELPPEACRKVTDPTDPVYGPPPARNPADVPASGHEIPMPPCKPPARSTADLLLQAKEARADESLDLLRPVPLSPPSVSPVTPKEEAKAVAREVFRATWPAARDARAPVAPGREVAPGVVRREPPERQQRPPFASWAAEHEAHLITLERLRVAERKLEQVGDGHRAWCIALDHAGRGMKPDEMGNLAAQADRFLNEGEADRQAAIREDRDALAAAFERLVPQEVRDRDGTVAGMEGWVRGELARALRAEGRIEAAASAEGPATSVIARLEKEGQAQREEIGRLRKIRDECAEAVEGPGGTWYDEIPSVIRRLRRLEEVVFKHVAEGHDQRDQLRNALKVGDE